MHTRPTALLLALLVLLATLTAPADAQRRRRRSRPRTTTRATLSAASDIPSGCDLSFAGRARRQVKLRTSADGSGYQRLNGGSPVTVAQWLTHTCSLDPRLPARVPAAEAMEGLETTEVTLEGFLVGVRFERHTRPGDGKDNDFHVEIAPSGEWQSEHVVVEVPPGEEYCEARQFVSRAVADDGAGEGGGGERHVFSRPVRVRVRGYVFLDSAHTAARPCEGNGGRGIRFGGLDSQVRGIWEIHPVLSIERAR